MLGGCDAMPDGMDGRRLVMGWDGMAMEWDGMTTMLVMVVVSLCVGSHTG